MTCEHFSMRVIPALVSMVLIPASTATAVAASNTDVNTQVTDAVTQANVKVVGEAPAIAMGTLYQTIAQSTALKMNAAPTLVQAATTLGQQQIYALTTSAEATAVQPRTGAVRSDLTTAYGKIDAITDRLDACGSDCLINIHVHVERIDPTLAARTTTTDLSCDVGPANIGPRDLGTNGVSSDAELLTACVVTRMILDLDRPIEGIATVIPDGDTGDSYTADTSGARWQDSDVTSIDLFVQRVA
jgi:hypothetical protein